MSITQVGFIGLRNMGFPMAAHLADAGFALTVSDAAPGVTERFVAEHPAATPATGPPSFAAVQALILMLPTSDIVEDVLGREQVAAATMSITVEALTIARAFGIAPGTMTEVLNSSSGRSNTSENKLSQFMYTLLPGET
jgi:3-hydroxyisobutyrate dehydrogenase-like beta-hydroxyacid dehydrogenase